MRFGLLAVTASALAIWPLRAQDLNAAAMPGSACMEFNQKIVNLVDNGNSGGAEAELSMALSTQQRTDRFCAAVTLHNMASVIARSGRFEESELLAERALKVFDLILPLDDPLRLRTLHLLWSAESQQGKRGKARQTFQSMRAVRLDSPLNRALFSSAAAVEAQVEGKNQESEKEYKKAISAHEEAGLGNTADTSILHCGLASLYIALGRLPDADKTINLAQSIANASKNIAPRDRINILVARATINAQRKIWPTAAEDLRSALLIADNNVGLNPSDLKIVLANFGYVLRKNHQGKEARAVEARAASMHPNPLTNAIVDVSELVNKSKTRTVVEKQ